MIVDATDLILGRMATVVAKKALLGETIDVVNCEKTVITGKPSEVLAKFKAFRERGVPLKGPFVPRTPERIVKRSIRGMLPYKKPRGADALARVKCHVGIPAKFKDKEITVLGKEIHVNKTHAKYMSIRDISVRLGARAE